MNASASARRRFLLVALGVPAVVVVIALALQLATLPSLPDPVAIHWGVQGPDGFGSPWSTVLFTVLLGAGIPALMAGTSMPGYADNGPSYRFLGAAVPAITTMLCTLLTWTQLMQAGLSDARQAPGVGLPLLYSVLAGLAVGAVCWLVQPKAQQRPAASPSEPLPLAAGERAVWFRETSLSKPALLLILGAVTAVGAGAVIGWLWAEPELAWTMTGLTVVLLAAAATATAFRVRVDGSGLTAVSVAGFPRFHVPLAEIRDAEAVTVSPVAEFGGWGLRWVPGRFGVVLRSGPALQVNRVTGRQFVVTVDDAGTAAALLQALTART
ncbi:DUF1648 domain-containing protein [Arthrobacter sp. zg-Y20]|uniref:DUF1648 domain-containing protein n=1 Tax=unclassified Arthrobacter TaxID=235627 RepID=UPI001D13CD08|nr:MULTISPECIES: DUF1648 domain-containing protein [unclassified Arthrobacter]MCC3277397.1 DUF1648 domain-containing protein [Arthrobacter sp. zg-Y20]MDK1317557.1 DUF1648 domain-containing protein [Arthrobacter sp. zg.Y20]WIB06946.1 DUF1648 domain-containing protein [Arthrobacter sp. zg-Y20]